MRVYSDKQIKIYRDTDDFIVIDIETGLVIGEAKLQIDGGLTGYVLVDEIEVPVQGEDLQTFAKQARLKMSNYDLSDIGDMKNLQKDFEKTRASLSDKKNQNVKFVSIYPEKLKNFLRSIDEKES